jgi:cell division protein FtsW
MADKKLFILASSLIIIGILFSYSLSVYTVLIYGTSKIHFFSKFIIIGVMSITIMWGISRLDANKWLNKFGFLLFISFFSLMFFMHFLPPDMITEAGGARRWVRLPFISLAPVEFFKIGFVFFLAWSFSRKIDHTKITLKEEAKRFMPYLLIFFIVVILIAIMQNDLGQVILLGSTLGIMAVFAGGSVRFFMILMLISMIFMIILIFLAEHRIDRILQWWANAQTFILTFFPDFIANTLRVENVTEPYQIGHSLNAIHNGGFFGKMFGNGEFKYGFLTEVHTDFVLAGIAEEQGFLGILILSSLFLIIIHRIFKIANRVKNNVYYLFCIGIALLIGLSFIINAFGISGIIPIKGLAVPFISYGGSSMISYAIAIGMILSISKEIKSDKL